MTVADATPLIALARIHRLELLHELYDHVLIGSVVKAETIDAGRSLRALGVEQIVAVRSLRCRCVNHVGTVSVLLEAHLRRGLGPDALEKALRDLGKTLWLSASVVAETLRRARKAKR